MKRYGKVEVLVTVLFNSTQQGAAISRTQAVFTLANPNNYASEDKRFLL